MRAVTTSPLVMTYALEEFWESPGAAIYDRNTKADTYAPLGVRELWLVNPENEIVEAQNLKPAKKGRKGVYGAGRVFKRGERVESIVEPKFSPSVSEIRRAVPRKSK
jgi:Uma2 family endonuclease